MDSKDRLLQRVLRDALVPLAVSAAQIKTNMPSRTGGYSISVKEILTELGRERITLGLIADAITHLKWLTKDSADSIVYDELNQEFVVTFNDKLTITDKFVYFDGAAAQRR